jgi:hypothetical protein
MGYPSMHDRRRHRRCRLKNFWGTSTLLSDDADILDRLGIDGGDAFDLIERFATKFEIDITNYHWHFHHGEEVSVNTIGSWFFNAPYRRVDRIPITSQVLAEAIRTKRWPLEYPEHKLPSVRWDIRFSQAVSLAIAAVLFGWGLSFDNGHKPASLSKTTGQLQRRVQGCQSSSAHRHQLAIGGVFGAQVAK